MVQHARADLAIVILAGGKATRLPEKLERIIDGAPLLAHVYRNMRDCGRVVIAGAGTFSPELDAVLDCPIIVDRWPGLGPLGGLLSACSELKTRRVFALAGDAPHVTGEVVQALRDRWSNDDEAAVPVHETSREPLAAMYDRVAVLREGFDVLHSERPSMHALLARLRTHDVPLDARYFTNINTITDLTKEQQRL